MHNNRALHRLVLRLEINTLVVRAQIKCDFIILAISRKTILVEGFSPIYPAHA